WLITTERHIITGLTAILATQKKAIGADGEAGPGNREPDVHQWVFLDAETFIVRRIDFRITVLHRPAFTTVRGMQNQRVVAHRPAVALIDEIHGSKQLARRSRRL